jgi:hypothetical protein
LIFRIDILRQVEYNIGAGQFNIAGGGGEFHVRYSNGGLGAEGASRSDGKPAGESLRSRDPTRFHLWKVGHGRMSDADGASPENSSGRISQVIKQRMRDKALRVLCFVSGL